MRFYYYLSGTIYAAHEITELLNNNHVVCDRYIYSTIAYHRALGISVNDNLSQNIIQADYTFCLYTKEEEIIKRIGQRENLGVFDTNLDFQKKIFQEFNKFPMEFFDTTGLSVQESVEKLLKKVNL